jgi:hypothetical protein
LDSLFKLGMIRNSGEGENVFFSVSLYYSEKNDMSYTVELELAVSATLKSSKETSSKST